MSSLDGGIGAGVALARQAVEELVREGGEARVVEPVGGPRALTTAIEVSPAGVNVTSSRGALEALGFCELQGPSGLWVGYDRDSGRWVELQITMAGGDPERRAASRRIRGLGVALMGPDGAGKSTVAAAVATGFYLPVRAIYMGLYQGGSRRRRSPIPGLGLAAALTRQWGRWLVGLASRLQGRLVLFDRYTYDALLPANQPLSGAQRFRRSLLARACPGPDLVVVLDAPAETLFARAGEHDLALLERHRRGLLELAERLPRTVVVDATEAPDVVARDVIAAIWRSYRRGL